MNKIKSALFDRLNEKDCIIITVFSIICLFLAISKQSEVLAVVTLLLSLYYSFKNLPMSLAAVVISGPLLEELTSGGYVIMAYAPFVIRSFVLVIKQEGNGISTMLYMGCVAYVVFSFLRGYESDILMFILQIIAMTIFYSTWKVLSKDDVPIVCYAYICCAIIVCIYIYMGGLDNNLMVGRLSLGDNIKKLSYICAIPLSFYYYSYIGRCKVFENANGTFVKLLSLLLTVTLFGTLFMTLARGVFLSFGIGTILLLLLSRSKTKSLFFFVFVAALLLLVSQYIENLGMFRIERLFETDQYETGNGRTEIWAHYISRMQDMGSRYILLGTGPGNISRISNIEFYAHSTILDYFFSYGIIGLFIFILVEITVLVKLFKKNNNIPFIIVLTFLFSYATHGGAANQEMFLLQAILLASVKNKSYEDIRYSQLVQNR